MEKIFRCKNCVTLSTRPRINFDERGLVSDTWTNVATNVPTRFVLLSESEARDGRNTTTKTFSAVVPGDTDVKSSDRLHEPSTDNYYEIQSVGQARMKDGRVYYKSLNFKMPTFCNTNLFLFFGLDILHYDITFLIKRFYIKIILDYFNLILIKF